ncbi:MAG: PH domain-containing protein [Gaiellaceae bacterium]
MSDVNATMPFGALLGFEIDSAAPAEVRDGRHVAQVPQTQAVLRP